MSNKKFSELTSADGITNNDLFAISSADTNGGFASNKVTFGQIKQQLDYDFEVLELKEVTPPPESDDTVYITINGYRVAATRAKEHINASFPTSLPRIIPVVSGFRAAKGKMYTIPFTATGLELSDLVMTSSDPSRFSLLKAFKIDKQSGYINLVTNQDIIGNYSSLITITDQNSGVSTTVMIYHSRLLTALENVNTTIIDNKIQTSWRILLDTNANHHYGIVEPRFSLSEDIKFKVYYKSDYFNQAYLFKEYRVFSDFEATIVLLEPYSGDLVVYFEDLTQGLSGITTLKVNYSG